MNLTLNKFMATFSTFKPANRKQLTMSTLNINEFQYNQFVTYLVGLGVLQKDSRGSVKLSAKVNNQLANYNHQYINAIQSGRKDIVEKLGDKVQFFKEVINNQISKEAR